MRIDAWAERWPHYLDHIAPVWRALPEERRGTLFVGRRLAGHAVRLGLDAKVVAAPPPTFRPILLAGWPSRGWRAPGRPIALIEHGAGQPYQGVTHGAHPGGVGRDRIGLYLCPNQAVADRNLAAYPSAIARVVGAPHLDRWHEQSPTARGDLVVVSWHFDSEVCPEASSAWPHYGPDALTALRDVFGPLVAGHAHPRLLPRIRHFYDQAGIPVIDHFPQVLDQAAVYACDNSSTLYEAASVEIPVVCMNAPWYRRNINHGLRFWDLAPGPQVDTTGQLVNALRRAITEPAWARAFAPPAVTAAYVATDGQAATRAAAAVEEWLETRPGGTIP